MACPAAATPAMGAAPPRSLPDPSLCRRVGRCIAPAAQISVELRRAPPHRAGPARTPCQELAPRRRCRSRAAWARPRPAPGWSSRFCLRAPPSRRRAGPGSGCRAPPAPREARGSQRRGPWRGRVGLGGRGRGGAWARSADMPSQQWRSWPRGCKEWPSPGVAAPRPAAPQPRRPLTSRATRRRRPRAPRPAR
jgi:hypothetical protein